MAPKKSTAVNRPGPGRPKKLPKKPLPDALSGKFCIAREHLDGHIETWTDAEAFERLEKALPREFEDKGDAEDYLENFRDATPEFARGIINAALVVPPISKFPWWSRVMGTSLRTR